MARHRTHRSDANQVKIVKALRQVGCEVHVIDRPVDLLVGLNGRWCLLEVKGPSGRLTPDQEEFFESPKGPASIVRNFEEAIMFVFDVANRR